VGACFFYKTTMGVSVATKVCDLFSLLSMYAHRKPHQRHLARRHHLSSAPTYARSHAHTHPGMEWLSMVFSDLEERRLSNMIHIYGCSVALGNYCGLLLTARADTEMCITHLVVVALFLIFRALEI